MTEIPEMNTKLYRVPPYVRKLYRLLRKSEFGAMSRREANLVVLGYCMRDCPHVIHQVEVDNHTN